MMNQSFLLQWFRQFDIMSGLSENAKAFIREFLKLMNADAVRALASAVTGRMVRAESRRACVDAIVLHSTSLDEFLKRKKVTKENLFKYLSQRGIPVPNTDKAALERQIKELIRGGNLALSSPLQSPVKVPVHWARLPMSGLHRTWKRGHRRTRADADVGGHAECTGTFRQNLVPSLQVPLTSSQPSSAHSPIRDLHLPSAAQFYLATTSATRVTFEERVRVNQPGGLVPDDFCPGGYLFRS